MSGHAGQDGAFRATWTPDTQMAFPWFSGVMHLEVAAYCERMEPGLSCNHSEDIRGVIRIHQGTTHELYTLMRIFETMQQVLTTTSQSVNCYGPNTDYENPPYYYWNGYGCTTDLPECPPGHYWSHYYSIYGCQMSLTWTWPYFSGPNQVTVEWNAPAVAGQNSYSSLQINLPSEGISGPCDLTICDLRNVVSVEGSGTAKHILTFDGDPVELGKTIGEIRLDGITDIYGNAFSTVDGAIVYQGPRPS